VGDKRARENELDIAKGIGIFLVMYGHGIETTFFFRPDRIFSNIGFDEWRFIYSFHMLLFFFLSGLVNHDQGTHTPLKQLSRFLFLVGMAITAHLAGTVLSEVRGYMHGYFDPAKDFQILWEPIVQGHDYGTIIVWFLVCLAIVQGMAYLCQRYQWPAYIFVGFLLLGSFVAWDFVTDNWWQFRSWAAGFAFFMLGVVSHKPLKRSLSAPAAVLAIAALALFAVVALTAPLNHGCTFSYAASCPPSSTRHAILMVLGSFGFLPLFAFTAASGCLATFFLSVSLLRSRCGRAIEWMGRHSLELMLINGFALEFVNPLVKSAPYFGDGWGTVAVLALVAAQIAILAIVVRPLEKIEGFVRRIADMSAQAVMVRLTPKLLPP
jgi:fucose 4-O-acetylase-like acetyltransferase